MTALLAAETLDVEVQARLLVRGLSLEVPPGALVAVLGPNGVGKTLLLHTLAGLRPAVRGAVRLQGSDLRSLGHRERALLLGMLLQEQDDPFPTTALETALMGRHARLGLWQWETAEDDAIARRALATLDLAGMEQRASTTLSGGERRRLALATLLVQNPDVLLLDEPLNHLDPRHQLAVLALLGELARSGKAVVASLHDPVVAARYFTSVLLLYGDGRWRLGPPATLLDAPTLAGLYGIGFEPYRRERDPASEAVMLPVASSAAESARSAPT